MDKLFPFVRRVRRPLLPADEPRSCSDAESVVPAPIEATPQTQPTKDVETTTQRVDETGAE
jgi:hypothetical protein